MKKQFLILPAALGMAAGALAQSAVFVDNLNATTSNQGVYEGSTFYTGPYGVQVWELCPQPSGAALTTLLNTINSAASPYAGYLALSANGFRLEAEVDGNNNSSLGGYYIGIGSVNLPDVSPAGASIILGLAVWNTSTSFAAMLTTPGALLGVIAFPQPTGEDIIDGAGAPDLTADWLSLNGGTGEKLLLSPIPEPGSLALLGLGVGALLAFRRHDLPELHERPHDGDVHLDGSSAVQHA